MTSPGLQNKFIVFQPVARSGKCFPNEGTLTINSSAPRCGVRPCGAARPSPSCALPAAERHGPAPGSRRPPSPPCGAGEGPFHLPEASRTQCPTFISPPPLGSLSGLLHRLALAPQRFCGAPQPARPRGHVPALRSISASARKHLFASSFLLRPGNELESEMR